MKSAEETAMKPKKEPFVQEKTNGSKVKQEHKEPTPSLTQAPRRNNPVRPLKSSTTATDHRPPTHPPAIIKERFHHHPKPSQYCPGEPGVVMSTHRRANPGTCMRALLVRRCDWWVPVWGTGEVERDWLSAGIAWRAVAGACGLRCVVGGIVCILDLETRSSRLRTRVRLDDM